MRRITWPLARLALAAGRFGRGETVPPLAAQGPLDVQETIRAFNHMRERLEHFVQDRTHVMAAISHDLSTPITALRVRAELIDEPDTQEDPRHPRRKAVYNRGHSGVRVGRSGSGRHASARS